MDGLFRRPAVPGDAAFLWRLHRETMEAYVEQTWGWDEAWQQDFFEEHFDPATRTIIEFEGAAIGCLFVERLTRVIFLTLIEISPAYQNQGIGTKLIRDLLEEARGEGVPVELTVLKVNPARRLYERLGFAVTGETATHFVMRSQP